MLIVEPIQNKEIQEEYCIKCGCKYDVDCLAYAAFVDGALVGISQFRLSGADGGHEGHIVSLRMALGTDDLDAMFIMGRQTMNFIDLAGVHECVLDDAISDDFAKKLGFNDVDGRYFVNLEGFFFEPCEHGKANSPR